MFCDMWKLYEVQISVFTNDVLLEHGHAHSFIQVLRTAELHSCNRDRCSVACKAKNIYCPTFYRESLPTPGLCWNSKPAQLQWHYLMTNTNLSAGTGSWKHCLSHSPTSRPLSMWGQVHHEMLLAAACCSRHWITWLVCLVACQKDISEIAFSFVVVNLVFPFQPLPGSFRLTFEKTKLVIDSFTLL